ncbi:MAG: ketol-acid reductoisomerase [Planctomycetia bacterium]|nr:MAG: ketol-acid reductoisomerase [Planctomycetia bacterium]
MNHNRHSPAVILRGADAPLDPLQSRRVAVLGYGSQGSAHALNLRDSGVSVIVAQRPGSPRHARALADGFAPVSIEDAAATADLLILALPDERIPRIFQHSIAPHMRAGACIGLIHGYAAHFGGLAAPPGTDLVLVAPKAQGRAVRELFVAGGGPFALFGVHCDTTGNARAVALAWAAGIGAARTGILETTLANETETDLFGEQAVLCGGLGALVRTAFDVLVEAGYPAELAYFECCHELKILSDLVHELGPAGARERISGTARFGDMTRGPRVVDAHVRDTLRGILSEIRSGQFAREWAAEADSGYAAMNRQLAMDAAHPIEAVGARLRAAARGA